MRLRVTDSLSGTVRPVPAPRARPLTLYVCGPTVYDAAHVGHARTYLYFDAARRYLEDQGVRVRHVMNITDFEDKITARAEALGVGWRTLARREERGFLRDLGALGILAPHATPRASELVPAITRVARRLARLGALERRSDGWYYRAEGRPAGPNFTTLADLGRHAVPEPGQPFPPEPGDLRQFLVWKPQAPPGPSWPSPWGRGMPGWHLECFAMAEQYLSLPVDLHGGGTDLVYPHHFAENEIAYALQGTPFARHFLHTAFVTAQGRKMSKSAGNLVPLRKALADVGPSAVRWYLLGRPFAESVEWNPRDLARARAEVDLVRGRLASALGPGAGGRLPLERLERTLRRAVSAVGEGLRVDRAQGELRALAAEVGRSPDGRFPRGDRRRARKILRRMERLLGLPLA